MTGKMVVPTMADMMPRTVKGKGPIYGASEGGAFNLRAYVEGSLTLRATSIEDADGRVRDFEYDNDQNLTAESWMSGSTVVATMAYTYDLGNELTGASDPNSAYAFAYNGDGQVTSTDNNGTANVPHVVLTAGYDLAGDMTGQLNGTGPII